MSTAEGVEENEIKNELEEEMSRFEQELAEEHPVSKPPIISANTFKRAAQAIQEAVVQPPIPHQMGQFPRPAAVPQMQGAPHYFPSPSISGTPMLNRGHLPPPPAPPMAPRISPRPIGGMGITQHSMQHMQSPMMQHSPMMSHSQGHQGSLSRVSPYQLPVAGPVFPSNTAALPIITPAEQKEWESAYTHEGETDKRKSSHKKFLRVAGTQVWEDSSLSSWDPNDFRIFCGDLGNEVTDESLTRAFSKYPSFLKAKIIRDKKSQKSKGYGFVSFKDPNDFIKAMREMNGKYIGNRPIKLRKSTWKDRNSDVVKKKTREKKKLGLR